MDVDPDKNPFTINKGERTKAMADSSSPIVAPPILKKVANQPPGITIKSEDHTVLFSQIDEVVNLCKTFSRNMEVLSNS